MDSREEMVAVVLAKREGLLGERRDMYPEGERKSCCMSMMRRAVVLGEREASWGQG